jgi:hypothetical protein
MKTVLIKLYLEFCIQNSTSLSNSEIIDSLFLWTVWNLSVSFLLPRLAHGLCDPQHHLIWLNKSDMAALASFSPELHISWDIWRNCRTELKRRSHEWPVKKLEKIRDASALGNDSKLTRTCSLHPATSGKCIFPRSTWGLFPSPPPVQPPAALLTHRLIRPVRVALSHTYPRPAMCMPPTSCWSRWILQRPDLEASRHWWTKLMKLYRSPGSRYRPVLRVQVIVVTRPPSPIFSRRRDLLVLWPSVPIVCIRDSVLCNYCSSYAPHFRLNHQSRSRKHGSRYQDHLDPGAKTPPLNYLSYLTNPKCLINHLTAQTTYCQWL